MSITVAGVSKNTRKPGSYFGFDTSGAIGGLAISAQKIALIGLRTAGSAVNGQVLTVTSEQDAIAYFGAGSMLHRMAQAIYKTNPYARVSAVSLADVGTKATGSFVFTGTALAGGSVVASVGCDSVVATVNKDDTAAMVATKVFNLINAAASLPVSSTNGTAGTTSLTAKNGGLWGNDIVINAVSSASGINVSITGGAAVNGVTPMSGGADGALNILANFLTPLSGDRWHVIVNPFQDSNATTPTFANTNTIGNWLITQSGPIEQRPGVCVEALRTTGSVSTAVTRASTNIANERVVTALARNAVSHTCEIAAAIAGEIVGIDDPAVPFDGASLDGQAGMAIVDNLTRTEQETCLAGGVTPLEIISGGRLGIVRLISTSTTGASLVAPDLWVRILDYVREAVKTKIDISFQGAKASNRTVGAIKAMILSVLYQLEAAEIIENVAVWSPRLVVEPDADVPGRVNARIPVDAVAGLHVVAGTIELHL